MVNMNGPVKMASYDMAGKTAVVTGGTKGIGKAIALAFGQCGANVVVAGRHEDECTAVAEAITSAGGHGKGIRTDVRNIDEIDALIAGAAETFGGVDILINCAGVAITKKILDLDVEDTT
ncbi:MAG: SDR family NAD(P)-dependent oxidoreductase [Coprococcus sp.]